jgi:hypothetical protein
MDCAKRLWIGMLLLFGVVSCLQAEETSIDPWSAITTSWQPLNESFKKSRIEISAQIKKLPAREEEADSHKADLINFHRKLLERLSGPGKAHGKIFDEMFSDQTRLEVLRNILWICKGEGDQGIFIHFPRPKPNQNESLVMLNEALSRWYGSGGTNLVPIETIIEFEALQNPEIYAATKFYYLGTMHNQKLVKTWIDYSQFIITKPDQWSFETKNADVEGVFLTIVTPEGATAFDRMMYYRSPTSGILTFYK